MKKRVLNQDEMGEWFNDPVIRNQTMGNNFVANDENEIELIGDFVGEKGYESFDDVVKEVKHAKKRIVLNIGDSSTSGWNADILTINKLLIEKGKMKAGEEIFPLFTYKTYPDSLRDMIGDKFAVLNAGVPTHTSLNSLRRLKRLVKKFEECGLSVDFVTLYAGNNDCANNDNVEEKNRHSKAAELKRKFTKNKIVLRTSEKDFKNNIQSIIDFCKSKNIRLIIIKPPVPLYWEPGRALRRKKYIFHDQLDDLFEDIKKFVAGKLVYGAFQEAKKLWNDGLDLQKKGKIKESIKLLERAKELDVITPRIKNKYVEILRDVSESNSVPFIDINLPKEKDDGSAGEKYFCDYCHPIERANKIIANHIMKKINTIEKVVKHG